VKQFEKDNKREINQLKNKVVKPEVAVIK